MISAVMRGGLRRELGWVVAGQAAAALGSIVGVVVIARILPPQRYGELILTMTLVLLVEQVLLSPLAAAFFRFYAPAKESKELASYLDGVLQLLGQALALPAFGAMVAGTIAFVSNSRGAALVCLACVFTLIRGGETTLGNIQSAARHRAIVAWHQGVSPWLRWLCAAATSVMVGPSSRAVLAGYCLGSGVVLLSQIIFFRRRVAAPRSAVSAQIHSVWRSKLLSFAWPFATWGIITWGHLASDRWALELLTDRATVGRYAVAYQMGYLPVLLATGALSLFIGPLLYQKAGDSERPDRLAAALATNLSIVRSVVVVTVFAYGVLYWIAGPIFRALTTPQYETAAPLLAPLVLAGGLFAAGQLAALSSLVSLRPKALIIPKVATALFGVVANFVAAAIWEEVGVVYAMVLFSGTYLSWMVLIARSLHRRKTD